jgi:PAS domain S-box-containing protein
MDPVTGTTIPHILLLEDDRAHQDLVVRAFQNDPEKFRVSIAGTIQKAREIIAHDPPVLIIADWILPDGKGIEILPRKDGMVSTPLIIVTSFGDEHLAVEIMKSGAIDYVVKSATNFKELPHIARRAIRDWTNIQERKKAEDAARDYEKRLGDIIGFLPDAMFAIDTEGRVIAWNNAIERMTGVSSEAMLGKGDHEYSLPFYGERRPILIDLVLTEDSGTEKKYDSIQRDGEKITSETYVPSIFSGKGAYLWGTASPLYDIAGNRTGSVEVIRDITERKQMELELVSAQQRLKEAHHLARIGTWDWVTENDTVTWSEEMYRITGRDPSQPAPTYAEHQSIYTPSSWERLSSSVTRALSTSEPYNLELELIHTDGSIRWMNAFGDVKHDADGKVIGLYGTMQDITDKKNAALVLQQREAVLETLLNAPHDTITLLDRQGIIIRTNDEGARRLGGTVEEVTGRCAYDLLPPDVAKVRKAHSDLVFESGEPVRFDDTRSGRYLHNEIFPIFNPEHTAVDRIAIFARDITDQKTAELALKESETRFRDLFNNMKSGMVIYEATRNGEDFIIRDINRAVETIEQVKKEEIVGRSVLEVFPGVREFRLFEVFQRVVKTGIAESYPVSQYHDNRISGWRENFIYKLPSGEIVALYEDVTEKKQVELALSATREWLGIALSAAHAGTWDWDIPTGRLTWSPEFFELFGLPPGVPALFETWLSSLHPDDRTLAQAKIDTSVREHTPLWNEYRIILSTGEIRWIGAAGSARYNEAGEPVRMSGVCIDITNRKLAEEQLHESEHRSAMLLKAIPDMMFVISRDGVYHDFSVPDPGLLALPVDRIIGTNIRDSGFKKESADAILYHIAEALRTKTLQQFEYELGIAGSTRQYEARIVALGEDEVLGIVRDITDRKMADEKLRESEERYASLFNRSLDCIYVHDFEGNFLDANTSALELLGYTREEIPHISFVHLLSPDQVEKAKNAVETIVREGSHSGLIEYRLQRKDGRFVDIETKATLIVHKGKPHSIFGIARDITERKAAEAALSESEIRFRALIQNSSDIIRILDRDGRITYESASAGRIQGYPPGYMIGKDPLDYIHPEDLERVKIDLSEVYGRMNNGIPTEFRIRKADGEYLWVDSIGTNLLEVPGVNGVVVTTRPIQQRKQAEEEINKTLRQLERSEALLRNVYDILPIGLWLADKTGKLYYGNTAGVKIWGAEPHVPLEQYGVFKARRFPSGEEIGPDDWALAHTILKGVTIKDEMLEIDAFDDKKKIILNYTAPLYDAAGNIDGAIVVNQEITDKVHAEQALRENQSRLANAMDIAGLVNWEYDVATGMFTFDDRFYALYETTAEREGGNLMPAETYMREFVYPDDRPAVLASIQKILATADPAYTGQVEHRITPRDGSVRTIIARFSPIMGPEGNVIRTLGANQDITDRKLMESEIRSLNTALEQRVKDRTDALSMANESLEEENARRIVAEENLQKSYDEKVLLLKEIHHRVKNNLQIIASLLNLQSRYITDESTLAAIRESQNRVKAMALVHEKLYRAEDIAHISLHEYIRFLGTGLFQFYDAKARGIRFSLEVSDVNVDIDSAIPIGLIVNELISNSLKYAFPDGRTGEIAISVKKEGHTLYIQYQDTGIGIPADMDWRNAPSLGLRLVNTLVDQMNGMVELNRSNGTLFSIVLHEKEPSGPS